MEKLAFGKTIMSEYTMNTILVHEGERQPPPSGRPVAAPIYTTVTYTYDSMSDLTAALDGESGDYSYSRYGNPNVAALNAVMRTIENGISAESFASGMAATHAALLLCGLEPGSEVLVSQDVYGATLGLLQTVFAPFGVRASTADFNNIDAVRSRIKELRPRVLFAETISNPLLKVCDIPAVADAAHSIGARLIIDNTFASPFLCRPLDLGADIVVHSATKYLSGHGDSMGGVVITANAADTSRLESVKRLVGGVLGPLEAHEITRGIKTLGIRQQRQCENATEMAEYLSSHREIKKVHFPTLSNSGDKIAHRILREPFGGALVTVVLAKGSRDAAFRFMDGLRLCLKATSLGDIQTLVSHPATSSHRELTDEQRADIGISDGMVRISVGIEDINDLINDISQALDAV